MRRQHDLTASCPQVVLLKRYLREKHVAVNHSRGYLLMRTMCPEMVASMTLVLVGHDNEPPSQPFDMIVSVEPFPRYC